MNKFYLSVLAITSALLSSQAKAQSGIAQLIKSGPADATQLSQAYAEPLFKGFGAGLNSGWYHTARGKDPLEFELKVTGTLVFTPNDYKTFDVTQIGLSNNIRPADPTKTLAPTIAGSNTAGPVMNIYDNNGNKIDQFTMPGRKLAFTPVPLIQASLGILGHTEITLRAIQPSVNAGDDVGRISMIGGGIKHDIMQDIMPKAFERQIPVHVAIAAGFTRMNYKLPLIVLPSNGAMAKDGQQSTDFSNQYVEGHFNGYNAELIVSKKLAFFVPFVSAGYNSGTTKAGVVGNYPITTGINNVVQQKPTFTTFTNPISISETSVNGVRADAGFQLEAGIFRLYASYSTFKYNTSTDLPAKSGSTWAQSVNGGIGLNW